MARPIVAIVGRPNVGKSTLFNKLIGERRSIVEDIPGVTRDRIYGETEWNGRKLTVIDTGGIEPKTDDTILKQMRFQAEIAIESADVIVFMCDVRTGLTADDRDIAIMLQKSGKPIIPCINKCDSVGALPFEFYEFYELGFECEPIAVSSVHGSGTGDLLDEILKELPENIGNDDDDDSIKVAVIGKPNAGKSSIINKIMGQNRLIVSDIAGTTRDAVDTQIVIDGQKYTFIDTAGIRRASKINDKIEKYSVLRAHMAVYILPDYAAKRLARSHPEKKIVNRIGLTTSKALGGAVVRSRVRRIMREALRTLQAERPLKQGFLIVIAGRRAATELKSTDIRLQLEYAFRKLDMFTEAK